MTALRKYLTLLVMLFLPCLAHADWQAPQDIGLGEPIIIDQVSVGLDKNGNAVAERLALVRGANRSFNGTWTVTVPLGLGDDGQIAVDQNGNAIAIWSVINGIYMSTYDSTSEAWMTPAVAIDNEIGATYSLARITISPNGRVLAAWSKTVAGLTTVRYATTASFNGLLTIKDLYTPNAATVQSIDVAISDNGQGTIGWIESPSFARVANVPIPPTAPLITDLATGPDTVEDISVAMNAVGDAAVAVWTDVTGKFIDSAVYNGAWGLPGMVPGSMLGSNPDVTMDDAGNAVAVWVQGSVPSQIQGAIYPLNPTGWQSTTPISAGAFNATTPQVAVDGDGNAVVAWNQLTAAAAGVVQARTLPFGTTTWGPVTNLSLSVPTVTILADSVRIAANDQGNVMVGWVISDTVGPKKTAQTAFNTMLSSKSKIEASSTTVLANGTCSSTITVTVLDGNGNPIPGDNISLTENGSGNVSISPPISITNGSGQAIFTVKDDKAEKVTFTATDQQTSIVIGTVDVTFIAAADPGESTAVASLVMVEANDVDTSTITVTLNDSLGNPLTNHTVQFTQSGVTSTIVAPNPAVTNANGVATFTVKSLNFVTGNTNYTATDITAPGCPVVVAEKPVVTFILPVVVPGNSTVVADPTQVEADNIDFSTITVTLLNAKNNPVPNHTVTLTQSAGGNSSIEVLYSGVTNAEGKAFFRVRNVVVENVTYTAKDTTQNVVIPDTATVSFIDLITDPTLSKIEADPTVLPADGIAFSEIKVTLLNKNLVPISGHDVQLSQNGSSSITPLIGTTDSNGEVFFTVRDLISETVTYTAKDLTGNVEITPTVDVTFQPRRTDAAVSTVTANPTSVFADGVSISTITVRLKNVNGAPVVGHNVTLAPLNGSSVVSQPSGPSDANGVVTFTVTDTVVESVTYRATDLTDHIVIDQTATVKFTPPPPLPASNFEGIRVVNKFATQKEFTDILTWTPSPGTNVVSYRIYVNGVLERTIPALGPYRAEFKHRCDNKTYVYRLVAVSDAGVESSPLFVTLPK